MSPHIQVTTGYGPGRVNLQCQGCLQERAFPEGREKSVPVLVHFEAEHGSKCARKHAAIMATRTRFDTWNR